MDQEVVAEVIPAAPITEVETTAVPEIPATVTEEATVEAAETIEVAAAPVDEPAPVAEQVEVVETRTEEPEVVQPLPVEVAAETAVPEEVIPAAVEPVAAVDLAADSSLVPESDTYLTTSVASEAFAPLIADAEVAAVTAPVVEGDAVVEAVVVPETTTTIVTPLTESEIPAGADPAIASDFVDLQTTMSDSVAVIRESITADFIAMQEKIEGTNPIADEDYIDVLTTVSGGTAPLIPDGESDIFATDLESSVSDSTNTVLESIKPSDSVAIDEEEIISSVGDATSSFVPPADFAAVLDSIDRTSGGSSDFEAVFEEAN